MSDAETALAKALVKVEGDGNEGTESSQGEAEESDFQIAADEVMAAFKSGDSASLAEALRSFFVMCKAEDYSDTEED